MNGREWTDGELASLVKHYREHGPSWEGWADVLPGRSTSSIAVKASAMGLTKRKARRWTEGEERALLAMIVGASRELGRSPMSVIRHGEYLVRNADRLLRLRGER